MLHYYFANFISRDGDSSVVDSTFTDVLRSFNAALPIEFRHLQIDDESQLGKSLRQCFGSDCIVDGWAALAALNPRTQRTIFFVKSRGGHSRTERGAATLSVLTTNLRDALRRRESSKGVVNAVLFSELPAHVISEFPTLGDSDRSTWTERNEVALLTRHEDDVEEFSEPAIDGTVYTNTSVRRTRM